MMFSTPHNGLRSTRFLLGACLAFTLLAFVSQGALAAPGCSGAKAAGCPVKSCAAKATCATAANATTAPGEEKKTCTKEECIAKCMAKGMTKEEAETCWTKHGEGKTAACHADSTAPQTIGPAGCAFHSGKMTVGESKPCTKEECVAKLMAAGMSKEEAEKKAAQCMSQGKCTGKHEAGKGCCALGGKK